VELEDLGRNWNRFGEADPLWAVLTDPDKRNGGWDVTEFFATGEQELGVVLQQIEEVHPGWLAATTPTGRAIDFGCGVGRLTQTLSRVFARCDGVDIAPSMIDQARRHAEETGAADRCTFHVNTTSTLSAFADDTFDFGYSAHVFQHMEPQFAASYVAELVRVLRPGGILAFQIPTEQPEGPSTPLDASARRARITVDLPASAEARSVVTVRLRVDNVGDAEWKAFSRSGRFHVVLRHAWARDGLRQGPTEEVPLGQDILPQNTTEVSYSVKAPPDTGRWTLELDVVQAGFDAFSDVEVMPARPTIEVTRRTVSARRAATTVTKLARSMTPLRRVARRVRSVARRWGLAPEVREPLMEMYGTPIDVVRGWCEAAGRPIDLAVLDWCELFGQEPSDWLRHLFIVRARPEPKA